MKAWLQHFKLVSTGRTAVSMPSMVLYLPLSFLFALEREFVLAPNNLNNQLKIVLAGELTSFLFLHISALTVLKNRKLREQNLFLCLMVWAMTGVIRGFFSEFYAASVLNYQSYTSSRILSSVLFSTLGLAFAAYSFGSIYAIDTKKSALRSLNGFILSENADLNSKQSAMKEEAIVTLQQSLVPKVIQLQHLTSGLKKIDASDALRQSLQSLEGQAHHLAYQMRVNLDKLESIPNPRTGVTSRLFILSKNSLAIWPNKLSVKLSILFLSIGGVIVQIGRNSISGVLSSLFGSVIIGGALLIFERLLQKAKSDLKQFLLISTFISVFAIQYFYASRLVPAIFNLDQPLNPWYSSAKITFAVFLASSFLSFLERDSSILKSMIDQSSSSRELLNLQNNRNEILEAANTSTNQGALQGQISGALLSLNLLTEDEDLNLTRSNAADIINNANILLTNAILEIKKISL
ncbi:unannotated protein [freshwater metagenome]|uniref:Unannotated protein n=2 Tax=freshwater metagenome TaxID=449393 RepID=A0A6J6U922_9ZZZZ|nr:hypothetical protein [Actinomycetota bacterium]MSW13997.1 hypothetical protein [Actinomycetota bacterium]MSX47500.1 hypothetical protein [Actinomycetota bacterium]MSX91708.1 hypothetical protein [Actinomycetota bacterium]MSY81652.1 hypothetical protein [Actinomycetota bacterium]